MKKLRIVFMGTPDFAVGILKAILEKDYHVVGVVTATDKPAGRGQKMHQSAVKTFALDHQIPVLQPTNLKSEEFLQELAALQADLQIVVAFRMLPEAVWKMPALGTFNLHASLLPEYRGAAPINWAIINGETQTGVTTFFIDDKIDTGEIILKESTTIQDDDTAGTLHDRLMHLGSETVIKTLQLIADDQVVLQKQPQEEQKTAYKLNRDNCKINWNQNTQSIHNHIRGLCPYPAAWTTLKDEQQTWDIKLFETRAQIASHSFEAGKVITDQKKTIQIATKDGFIEVLSLQFPGKRRMQTQEFLNGVKLSESSICQ